MAINKGTLGKETKTGVEYIYPKTSSDIVEHGNSTVETVLDNKVDKVSGKGLSSNDYTTLEKEKLEGIETGAQVNDVTSVFGRTGDVTLTKSDVTGALGYTPPTSDTNTTYSFATGDTNGTIKVTPSNGTASNVSVKGLGTAAYQASTAFATSGHSHSGYSGTGHGHAVATNTAAGFMSSADKAKLDGIAEGATASDANTTYTFETGGSNGTIKITPSDGTATNVSVKGLGTAAYKASTEFATSGHTHSNYSTTDHTHNYAASNHSHGAATSAAAGFMSAADKKKLDGIAEGATNTTDTNTTYTFATGGTDGTFSVTPSGGSAQNVAIKGLGTAAYQASTAFATSGHTHSYLSSQYTTHLYAGASNGSANASTANGNTHLILVDDTTVRNRIKISGSGATTVTSDASGNITISSTDTNSTYSFSNNNPTLSWGTKSTVGTAGGVAFTVTMPANPNTDTDTHWTSHLYAGTSNGSANAATTNGDTYLIALDNSTVRDRIKIVGSGATTVTSDANGIITINSTDTNTDTNTHNTAYLYAGTSDGSANAATSNGGTYLILTDGGSVTTRRKITGSGATTVTSDASGNITISSTDNNTTYSFSNNNPTLSWGTKSTVGTVGGTALTVTMPSNPNTNTTYTFAEGGSNGTIKVTPSGGSATNVSVKGLGTAAYQASTAFATSGHTHSAYASSSHSHSSITDGSANVTVSSGNINLTIDAGDIIIRGDLIQDTGVTPTFNIGTSAKRFQNVFASNVSGDKHTMGSNTNLGIAYGTKASKTGLIVGDITSSGNAAYLILGNDTIATKSIIPGTTNNINLGSSSMKWASIYATTIYEGGTSLSSKYATSGHTHSDYMSAPSKGNFWEYGDWNGGSGCWFYQDLQDSNYEIGMKTVDSYITLDNNDDINIIACNSVKLKADDVRPFSNNATNLGNSSYKWKQLYAMTSTISTSDRNKKNTIESIDSEKAKKLIMGLIPSTYKFNDADTGRTHWGLISQDIEELLSNLEWSTLDFAGFIKSPVTQQVNTKYEDENGVTHNKREYVEIEGEYDYSLRYEEFISPTIRLVQDHETRISTLENENAELKTKVSTLETTVSRQQAQIDQLLEAVAALQNNN